MSSGPFARYVRAGRIAGSGRKPLASTGTAGGENLTATLRRHARTETVAVLADEFARLIGPFHVSSPADLRELGPLVGAARPALMGAKNTKAVGVAA